MIVFPNCKINLGLHILQKRKDGFHDLETVFYPLPLRDGLEIIQHPQSSAIEFSSSGLAIDTKGQENICEEAYHLLKKDFPQLPGIKMHLHKVIPSGAGLGGGSSDGAFTLRLLNQKFRLGLSQQRLIDYGLQLGSDCPFFIINKPCFATGRGEKLEEVKLDLSAYKIVLVNPNIHVNTGWAFSKIQPRRDSTSIREIIRQPVNEWEEHLTNDFEPVVFAEFPEVQQVRDQLYAKGAVYAAMSGSGSTVFSLFEQAQTPAFDFPAHYFIKTF